MIEQETPEQRATFDDFKKIHNGKEYPNIPPTDLFIRYQDKDHFVKLENSFNEIKSDVDVVLAGDDHDKKQKLKKALKSLNQIAAELSTMQSELGQYVLSFSGNKLVAFRKNDLSDLNNLYKGPDKIEEFLENVGKLSTFYDALSADIYTFVDSKIIALQTHVSALIAEVEREIGLDEEVFVEQAVQEYVKQEFSEAMARLLAQKDYNIILLTNRVAAFEAQLTSVKDEVGKLDQEVEGLKTARFGATTTTPVIIPAFAPQKEGWLKRFRRSNPSAPQQPQTQQPPTQTPWEEARPKDFIGIREAKARKSFADYFDFYLKVERVSGKPIKILSLLSEEFDYLSDIHKKVLYKFALLLLDPSLLGERYDLGDKVKNFPQANDAQKNVDDLLTGLASLYKGKELKLTPLGTWIRANLAIFISSGLIKKKEVVQGASAQPEAQSSAQTPERELTQKKREWIDRLCKVTGLTEQQLREQAKKANEVTAGKVELILNSINKPYQSLSENNLVEIFFIFFESIDQAETKQEIENLETSRKLFKHILFWEQELAASAPATQLAPEADSPAAQAKKKVKDIYETNKNLTQNGTLVGQFGADWNIALIAFSKHIGCILDENLTREARAFLNNNSLLTKAIQIIIVISKNPILLKTDDFKNISATFVYPFTEESIKKLIDAINKL